LRQFREVRAQRLGADLEHFRVHIRMAPLIDVADEAGLRPGSQLVEQRIDGLAGYQLGYAGLFGPLGWTGGPKVEFG
jgi:hypothetical protein